MSSMTGKCLCGAVKFVAEIPDTKFGACHCGMCRKWSGGAAFFGVPAASVTFEGEQHIARYDSSAWGQRCFCKQCGTSLCFYVKPAQRYLMSIGAFDEAQAFTLGREIFIDRKPDGYAFVGNHPRMTEAEFLASLAPSA
jgi:hypothetical protein